uniref:Uncharacterized protein n=1 Tax=Romanomermis culicivorax TaxID=13658 RepID=A0A915KDH5_ROMCU
MIEKRKIYRKNEKNEENTIKQEIMQWNEKGRSKKQALPKKLYIKPTTKKIPHAANNNGS